MAKNKIKFNKYNSKSNYNQAKSSGDVDNATFSVVRTPNCNANENNNNTGDVKDLYISDTKLTDVYNSRMTGNDVTTTVTVGGIKAGTPLSDLTSISLGEVLDKILFKTTYPVIKTQPSVSISYSSVNVCVGGTFRDVVQNDIIVNKGQYAIELDGSMVDCGVVSNGLESFTQTPTPPSKVVTASGLNKIDVTVVLQGGPTPTDSDGNPYTGDGIPYTGGTIYKTITINPYYDWYATGVKVPNESSPTIDYTSRIELRQLDVVNHMGIQTVNNVMLDMGGGDIENKQTIKVPGTISNVQVFTQGTWKNYAFSDWYEETNREGIYHVYQMKDSAYTDGAVGGTRLKFTVTP